MLLLIIAEVKRARAKGGQHWLSPQLCCRFKTKYTPERAADRRQTGDSSTKILEHKSIYLLPMWRGKVFHVVLSLEMLGLQKADK